jgi:hypothetical protein
MSRRLSSDFQTPALRGLRVFGAGIFGFPLPAANCAGLSWHGGIQKLSYRKVLAFGLWPLGQFRGPKYRGPRNFPTGKFSPVARERRAEGGVPCNP